MEDIRRIGWGGGGALKEGPLTCYYSLSLSNPASGKRNSIKKPLVNTVEMRGQSENNFIFDQSLYRIFIYAIALY